MVDITSLSDGLALFKSGMEGMRGAVGLWKEFKGALPVDKQEHVDKAIERSEEQLKLAEAQIAKGLGFPLCHCAFPPPIMLRVGYFRQMLGGGRGFVHAPAHECPRCHQTDALGQTINRAVPAPGQLPDPADA
jgi:hypothetical protein